MDQPPSGQSRSGKFLQKMAKFSIFIMLGQKIASDIRKKYLDQNQVGPLFPACRKYTWVWSWYFFNLNKKPRRGCIPQVRAK